MKSLSNLRLILIVASVIIGVVYAMPNFFNTSKQNQSFNFLPGKKINLGLDLKDRFAENGIHKFSKF